MAVKYGSLPFAEQIAFFRGKINVPTLAWTDIWRDAHDTSFMVAGAYKADLLADFRESVRKGIEDGTTIQTFRQDFDTIVAKHGWSYKGARGWRTRVIYETNIRTSYQAGRYAQLTDPDLLQSRPYWRYKHSDSVRFPRPHHLAWDDLVLRHDDPWWQAHYPPNGWGCFLAETPVRCDALLGLKTWYAGEMVELHTALGNQITATANHPVLTRRGWVPAGQIQERDELIGAAGDVNAELLGIVDHKQPPSRADNLFDALAPEGLRVVPMAPHDFHGDAILRKPEIHIAGSDGALVNVVEAALRENGGKFGLDPALHGGVEPTNVSVGPAQGLPVFNKAVFAQDATYGRLCDTEPPGNLRLAEEAAAIQGENPPLGILVPGVGHGPRAPALPLNAPRSALYGLPFDSAGNGHAAQRDAPRPQCAPDCLPAASLFFSQLLEANPGAVACDEVVEVREFQWSGHVYDFVTATGLIIAGGLLVSNCKCTVYAESRRTLRKLGKSGPDRAPPVEYETKTVGTRGPSPRTVSVPKGIDPGWDYAPGRTVAAQVREQIQQRLTALPQPIGQQLAKAIDNIPAPGGFALKPNGSWTIEDDLGGIATGKIEGNEARIIGMRSSPYGATDDVENALKRRGFFRATIRALAANGVTKLRLNVQSTDTRAAVKRLIVTGELKNPRLVVDGVPTVFDIGSNAPPAPQ